MTATYNSKAIKKLLERTEYEAWFLEEVYRISEEQLNPELLDTLVYPPDGNNPKHHIFGSTHIIIGDWRPQFLDAGAPLILISTFKLLDMILEWILEENGQAATFRFKEKINALKGALVFPKMIDSNLWLRERLIALYEQLEPLRGTIIHDRHFQVTPGVLHVSASKKGKVGSIVVFSPTDLRNLSLTLVSVLRYLQGSWTLTEFQLKRIRHSLDGLARFHLLPSLGQLLPGYLIARLYAFESNQIIIDIDKMRLDVARFRPQQDAMFDIRLILILTEDSSARAVRIPWVILKNAISPFVVSIKELSSDEMPSDVDIPKVMTDLTSLQP
jgi:hypothetical protein